MEESRRRLNPLHGIGAFALIMLLFLFVFAPLQYAFGMAGLALTELGLLLAALLLTRLAGQSFRETFPIHRPKFGQLAGTVFIWIGCFLIVMICTLLLMYFFPDGMLEVSSSMNAVFGNTPPLVSFLIVALMPAVCEEAVHRGFILFTFKEISRDWIVVLCMGLIFGIFHWDPYRFLPTAILGMGLTYVMQKTHNLLLPALFHFINNSMSFLSSLGSGSVSAEEAEEALALFSSRSYTLIALGSYLIIGWLAPVLLYVGSHMLRKSSGCLPKYSNTRQVLTAVAVLCISALMLIAGFALVFLSVGTVSTEELMQDMGPFM